MPPKASQTKAAAEKDLAREIRKLTKEVEKLKDLEFLRVFKHPWKFMWFSFLKGAMVGFGSVLGASVLVGVFVYALAQISLVPYLGDFVKEIVSQVQMEKVQPEDLAPANGLTNGANIE